MITVRYLPDKECLELKSFKYYMLGYRNMGIFYENAVNRVADDIAKACKPVWLEVTGKFTRAAACSPRSSRAGRERPSARGEPPQNRNTIRLNES